jgi:hypothetical protein
VREGIWGFLLGCVLTGGALGIYASGLKAELSAAQVDVNLNCATLMLLHSRTTCTRNFDSSSSFLTQSTDCCFSDLIVFP